MRYPRACHAGGVPPTPAVPDALDPAPDPVADPAAVLTGPGYRVTVLTDGLLRLEHAPDDRFEDRASTFAVHRRLPVPELTVVDDGTHLQVATSRLRLTYDKGPFTAAGLQVEVLGGITTYHSVWRYGDPPSDLGGTARTLDGVDGAIALGPGVVSRRGFAVLDDSTSFVRGPDGEPVPRASGTSDLYVFAYGLDHAEAVRALYAVSGPQPLLPRWALGSWWSRYHRYTADTYAALLDRFEAEGLPFSVAVVDMDWHVTDVDPELGSGWTGYTWDRELFPDPEAFLADLHRRGLRVTLNVHPADGIRRHEDAYERVCSELGRDPALGEPVPFDLTDPDFARVYLEQVHHPLEDEGVDFWWLDWQSGPYSRLPGVDPLWLLNHLHFHDSARDGRRPLTFSRYAGPGSHRYPVGFSGDAVVSWDSLAFQPRFTATAANIGYGWWSHDVGGHMFGYRDDELTTRWVQLGTFSPILRLHSGSNPFLHKEPWEFPPAEREVQAAFLRLRHRLVPYLHAMNHRAADEGLPLVVPLYHRWPHEPDAYEHPDQVVFGDRLLVAPVVTPADRVSRLAAVPVWLPEGTWVDLLTDRVYDGGRRLVLHRDLTTIPVLARAGTVLALDGDEVPANDPVPPERLELVVVPGADGEAVLVDDDGAGVPRVVRTRVTWDDASGTLRVHRPDGPGEVLPTQRTWTVTVVGDVDRTPAASIDGEVAEVEVRRHGVRTSVTVGPVPVDAQVEVVLGAGTRVHEDDVGSLAFAVLDRAHCGFELKRSAHEVAGSGAPLHVRLTHLQALGLPEPVLAAVTEVLLARGGCSSAG